MHIDLSKAFVVTAYLSPHLLKKLYGKLLSEANRDTRLVTYCFSIPCVKPSESVVYIEGKRIFLSIITFLIYMVDIN